MIIEVVDGVPRCTELTFTRFEGGREIRQRDLRAVELDAWIESIVGMCAGRLTESPDGVLSYNIDFDFQAGMKAIRDVRKGSRRTLTDARKQKVAELYNTHETGGIEAVMKAFGVSRSTAIRYIKATRESGLIEKRDQ